MAGKLASAGILLLHSPLSADSCSLFHFSDVHCLHALWSKTSSVSYASRNYFDFIRNEFIFLCFLTFYIFITSVS